MSVLERVARAERSSNLKHKEAFCDVDVLGAVGMAACDLSVYRVKYLRDPNAIEPAVKRFIGWARNAMRRRGMNLGGAARIGKRALVRWMDDACQACHGLKFVKMPGTPVLSDRVCCQCNGTGKQRFDEQADAEQVILDVMSCANELVQRADIAIARKLN